MCSLKNNYFLCALIRIITVTTWKIKVLKKWKKCPLILSFYTSIPQMMIIWSMVPEIWSATEFFVILDYFLPFYPPPLTTQKTKILKKWKKSLEISSFKCTKNHDNMLNCSWDMVHHRCNCYFSFWAILPSPPLAPLKQPEKSKFWKNEKTSWRYHLFKISSSVPKIMIISYTVPEIWRLTELGLF